MNNEFNFSGEYTKLNIACGPIKENIFPKPWLNIDVKSEFADFELDAICLPDQWENSFWEVRASHVIEHFFLDDWNGVICQWLKVLKPGGILRLSLPDFEIVLQNLNEINNLDHKGRPVLSLYEQTAALTQIYGLGYMNRNTEQRWRHRIVCTKEAFCSFLIEVPGVNRVYDVKKDLDTGMILGIRDDSQNSWSMTVCAEKKCDSLGPNTAVEQLYDVAEPGQLLIYNKEGQILSIAEGGQLKIPKFDAKNDVETVIRHLRSDYGLDVSKVSSRRVVLGSNSKRIVEATLEKIHPFYKKVRCFLLPEEFLFLKNR